MKNNSLLRKFVIKKNLLPVEIANLYNDMILILLHYVNSARTICYYFIKSIFPNNFTLPASTCIG